MRSFVRCPTCRQKLLLTADAEGQRKRCPRCATRFAVGSPLHVVHGLVEYLAFELFDQDPVDEIEVLDDEIEVLDDPPPHLRTRVAPPPTKPPPPPVVAPPVKRRRRRRRRDYPEDWCDIPDPDFVDYNFDPRDRPRWNMVQWGITLVLLPLLLFFATFGLSFSSLFVGMGSGLEFGGAMLVSGVMAVACDVLRLVGYGLCLNVPGKSSNRLWVMIALILSLSSGVVLVIPIAVAEVIGEPAVILGLFGGGIVVAMCAWGAYLMFLEGVAEMFNERGIADSVSALIKLGATYMVCVLLAFAALVIMVAVHANQAGIARSADPTDLVTGICWGIFCAFTSILGLVVFIKYILVLLNVRAMIDWCT
jgi:hypothetical protein